jgi:hypothetical protein
MRVVLPGDRVTSDDRLLADRQTLSLSRWQFSRIRSRGLRRAAWGAVPLVVGALALSWVISRTAPPVDSPWRPLPFFVLITYVLAGAGIIAWLLRNPLLRCPQCSQSLAEGMAPYFAIVTGRCPKCAATIFEDDAVWIPEERAGIAGAKLLSRAELLAAGSDARRSATPRTIKWGLSGALLVALGSWHWARGTGLVALGSWHWARGTGLVALGSWHWARGTGRRVGRIAEACPGFAARRSLDAVCGAGPSCSGNRSWILGGCRMGSKLGCREALSSLFCRDYAAGVCLHHRKLLSLRQEGCE